MKLLDIVNSPWAIIPEKLVEIRDIYAAHLRGDKIDMKSVEAQLGKPLRNKQDRLEVQDGVAVIPVEGVLAKRMNMMHAISGGASTQLIEQDIREAAASKEISAIVLSVDSPGGTVDGTQELANVIANVNQIKPVVAFGSGVVGSAAYWLASAAGRVFISGDTTAVGSIGVVATHIDHSKQDHDAGLVVTEITAGKFKRIASSNKPLTEEGRATIQAQVDHLYSVFVRHVANNRGVTVDEALSRMADGRLFLGQAAIDVGLVDGVSTLDDLIERLRDGDESLTSRGVGATPIVQTQETETMEITIQSLRSDYPDLVAELESHGAAAERARIQAVEEQLVPGHEDLIAGLKFDGKTTGPEAAVQVLAAERAARASHANALHDDAPTPIPEDVTAEDGHTSEDNLPLEERCKRKWENSPDLRAEFLDSFDRYLAYAKAEARKAAA